MLVLLLAAGFVVFSGGSFSLSGHSVERREEKEDWSKIVRYIYIDHTRVYFLVPVDLPSS